MRFHRTLNRAMWAASLLLGMTASGQASTVGKMAGVVKDAATGLPIPFASVTIVGTTTGAATTESGEFAIINVPAGTYAVQAAVIGYKPTRVDNVLVSPDFTTEVTFSLESTVAATLEPIRITAERPLIQRDATATVRVLDSEQYNKLPTRGYQDAASVQAGVVGAGGSLDQDVQGNESTNNPVLFIRGGRANEVAYFVDGFSQQDPLTGYSTTSINNNAVDQVVVMTGGFNAEYGRIMSGAVNVVTKEGLGDYYGTIEAVTDNLAGDWIGAEKYDYNLYDLSLGGPLIPGQDKLLFFASGERRWYGDRSPHATVGGMLPNNHLSGITWQGKVTWKAAAGTTLKAGTLGSEDDWREYLHTYYFNQDHMPRYEDKNNSFFGTLSKDLGPETFLNLGGTFFKTERTRADGQAFDDLSQYIRTMDLHDSLGVDTADVVIGNPRFDDTTLFWLAEQDIKSTAGFDSIFIPAHAFDDFLHRKSQYVGFNGDVTHQWSGRNTLKLGADFQRHTLRYYNHFFPTQVPNYNDLINYGFSDDHSEEVDGNIAEFEDGAKHPITASVFLQNKYEYDDFVLNAGIRYDHLDPKTPSLASNDRPFGPDDNDSSLDPLADLQPSKKQDKVSPRLGFGFPVSERTLFHANYGKFFQQPNLEDLYTSYRFLEYKVNLGGYYIPFGNPNLVPETTTAYEVGLAHAISHNTKLDVTAYYKDVKDLVQVTNISSFPSNFASYRNTDYGTIKGLDLAVEMRPSGGISGGLNYSLSYAIGTGSASQTQRNVAWTSSEAPKLTAPLAFDQRHKLTVNLDVRAGRDSGPKLGSWYPLENSGVNLLFSAGSGFPYTPLSPHNEVTLGALPDVKPLGPINSRYGPWTNRLDAKVNRDFMVSNVNLQAFVWVLNVLDTVNEVTVYNTTGSARTTGWLATEDGIKWSQEFGPEGVARYRLKEQDPNNFSIPRMVRFGLKMSFS